MATFREWFDKFTESIGEKPTHIVLGWDMEWSDYYLRNRWPEWDRWGVAVAYDDVPAAILDHEFDDSFGSMRSPDLAAWSELYVLFSDNYDGSEDLRWVPRNPTDHKPVRPGGG